MSGLFKGGEIIAESNKMEMFMVPKNYRLWIVEFAY